MDIVGGGMSVLVLVTVNILLLLFCLSWIPLAIFALMRLRRLRLSEVARVWWTTLVITIPYLGALALFIVQPDKG